MDVDFIFFTLSFFQKISSLLEVRAKCEGGCGSKVRGQS
jgi:hypothetical protein